MMVHVAIDARMVNHAGIGTYIRELVPRITALRPDWRFSVIVPRGVDTGSVGAGPNVTAVKARSGIYSIGQQLELPRLVRPDLWWFPHYDVPLAGATPMVASVHDVAHLALSHLYGGVLRTNYARLMFRQVRRNARRIIFVSNFTASEFARRVGSPRGESSVIHNGVDDTWLEESTSVSPHPRPYLLFVGSVKPHKNLRTLLDAFARLHTRIDHDLVVIGEYQAMRTIDRAALTPPEDVRARVHFLGGVEAAVLRRYVRHAGALVFPSIYEGFGLPPLEAMAAGCPCVVSNASAIPEVCGDAALYAEPLSAEAIAAQILRVVDDHAVRDDLIARGRRRAGAFTWESSARQTADVLEAAL